MKLILPALLLSTSAVAAEIPLATSEQTKVESLVRKIPSALIKTEELPGFERKHYLFPQYESNFKIKCTADHYNGSAIPSVKECSIEILEGNFKDMTLQKSGDEYKIEILNPSLVSDLFNAISYGVQEKKLYSYERVYGKGFEGRYRKLFRYSLICKTESCVGNFTDLTQ